MTQEPAAVLPLKPTESATEPSGVSVTPRPLRLVVDDPRPLRLDLGCGPNKKKPDVINGVPQPWIGVDSIAFPGVDVVCDLSRETWPWPDNSVDEAHASHFLEHLTPRGRIHFANELCRVLRPGAKATIITPHWNSHRAYGDLTHQWPPVSEMWFGYLNKKWRAENAPHTDAEHMEGGYSCDFDTAQPGYAPSPAIANRSQEFVAFALTFYRGAADDMLATIFKRKP